METLRIRCPGCQKLYGVSAQEIKDPTPEFKCKNCQTVFAFNFPPTNPENIPTFKVDSGASVVKKSPDTSVKECPKCQFKNKVSDQVCRSCGIIFERFEKRKQVAQNSVQPASLHLVKLWDQVLASYENLELHERFISESLNQKQLPYASSMYRKILEANPSESTALKMRDKLISLATVTYIPSLREKRKTEGFGLNLAIAILGLAVGFAAIISGFSNIGLIALSVGGVATFVYIMRMIRANTQSNNDTP